MLSDKSIIRPWNPSVFMRVVQNLKKLSAKFFRKRRVDSSE